MATLQRVTPFLWFDKQAEEAAKFYVSIFPGSRIVKTSHYPNAGQEVHHKPAGSVMVVVFELDGVEFSAINGGTAFKLNEAVSFVVNCDSQAEVDRYWDAILKHGGKPQACGWIIDKFGLRWQIHPSVLGKMLADPDKAKAARAMKEMLKQVKFDIAKLEAAFHGK